jgi:hypothetical protein
MFDCDKILLGITPTGRTNDDFLERVFRKLLTTSRGRLPELVAPDRLRRILTRMLDEAEFLSPFGVRSLSKFHESSPLELDLLVGHLALRLKPGLEPASPSPLRPSPLAGEVARRAGEGEGRGSR